MANGERLSCKGKYENIWIDIQGTKFQLYLFSLPLNGLNLVLGIQWLQTFGFVLCDWRRLTMTFMWDNSTRRIQGIKSMPINTAIVQSLAKDCLQK